MRKDHRPYFLKKLHLKLQETYVNHFLRPHFEFLGEGFTFIQPWHVEIFGGPIKLGNFANVIATKDKKVRLSIWTEPNERGFIDIGNYCLICPGVRVSSSTEIVIGDNCMLASSAYITDSDWHDIYNRIALGKRAPVHIKENVWIGDSSIVCKGVTIGENSIIGAGSVVVNSIPENSIAAGNPAKVVKHLDPNELIVKRSKWFSDPSRLNGEIDQLDRDMLSGNTIFHWLRYIFFPAKYD